ncbi:MAG: hypothetical protein R3247_15170, partial [Rhodothermales bacterium]|nr:hypothetical protein [Rhodothermales bacterium]
YLFVEQGGRFRIADPEDLVPRSLRDAYARHGMGSGGNPDIPANPGGAYQRPDQVFAEALVEAWRDVFTQLAVYHPDFEEPLRALEMHDDDIRATGGGTVRASSLAFVKGMQTDFRAQARAAAVRRESEAPRAYSRIGRSVEPLPVDVRHARFLAGDGTTRTEVFWSHPAGTLRPPRRVLEVAVPDPSAVPDRYFIDLVVSLHAEDYSRRVPTRVRYLAAEAENAAPVQVLDVAGGQAVNHLTFQWDQYTLAGGTAAADADAGAYLRTGVHRVERLAPLRANPAVLEMSDLKPVALGDDFVLYDAGGPGEEGAPVPYPRTTLTPETPLGLYFEIYHLAFGPDDQTHYTVAYDVVRPGGRTTSARSTYAGTERTARELIGIDLREYDRPGPLEIIVRVTDDTTGQTMERAVAFDLAR